MKKIGILSVMTLMLLAVGVNATSDIQYWVDSPSGNVEITTSYSVGGFDSQTQTTQMTSSDYQHIENTGTLSMTQHIRSYGTGLAWPDTNNGAQSPWPGNGEPYGEWAGKQSTVIDTIGKTIYEREEFIPKKIK